MEKILCCTPRAPEATGDPCLIIANVSQMTLPFPSESDVIAALHCNLKLLRGIGVHFDRNLRETGYASIPALTDHPRWGEEASKLLKEWGSPLDPTVAHRTICNWLSASDPLFLKLLGCVPCREILFFDLETLGLANAPIFLAATARWTDDGLLLQQYLAPSLAAEFDLLVRVAEDLETTSALVTYNGKSFDWTVLSDRLAYYGLPSQEARMHVDLLHHARRRYGDRLPDLRLGTLEEEVLGIRRVDDLPSSLVPEYYTAYLESGNAGPLLPIVNHNRQDIISLAHLLGMLLGTADDGG